MVALVFRRGRFFGRRTGSFRIAVGRCVGGGVGVDGRVFLAAVHQEYLVDGRPNAERLRPLTKLGGNQWGTLGEVLHLARIPYEEPAR